MAFTSESKKAAADADHGDRFGPRDAGRLLELLRQLVALLGGHAREIAVLSF